MEDMSCASAPISLSVSRFTDDRASTDSGIGSRGGSSSSSSSSSSVGGGSSDERSGSRSSAFSGLDESGGSTGIALHHQALSLSRKSPLVIGVGSGSVGGVVGGASLLAADRFYAHQPHSNVVVSSDGARVWRDPSAFLTAETNIRRHVDSLQHQSLLMSHPAVATGSPSSSSSAAVVSPSSIVAAPTTPSAHYPQPASVTSMITPHLHHQLPPHSIYPQIPEMLWKQQRYAVSSLPITPAHLHPVTEELFERERVSYHHDRERQDRLFREREQEREADKQQKEREKHLQERERQEKDKLEKQRAEQAVHEHFAESLKRSGYNVGLSALPPVPVARVNEEERKRHEQQQRLVRSELRDREKISSLNTFPPYSAHNVQVSKSVSSNNKNEYITSTSAGQVIQNRVNPVKSQMTLPKSEPVYNNMHGYPAYQKPLNFNPDKPKIEQLKNSVSDVVINSLANTKSSSVGDRDHDAVWWNGGINLLRSPAPPPHDMKNSVIVKNDVKNLSQSSHLLSTADRVSSGGMPSHSLSPKLRVNDPHYLQPVPSSKSYEYRSPSQSPLQASHAANSTSPHQLSIDAAKLHHRAQPPPSSHHRQSPLPPTHRQSPHHRQSPLPASQQPPQLPMSHHRHSPHSSMQQAASSSPEQRYGALYSKTLSVSASNAAVSYPYSTSVSVPPSVTVVSTPTKPKVSSPVPPHMYTKPLSSVSSNRGQDINPMSILTKTLIPPSPYQQLSQHQLPPNSTSSSMPSSNLAPPPAHSSHTSSVLNDFRLFPPNTNHTNLRQPELSAGSASVTLSQTQPLDLGVRESAPRVTQSSSPVALASTSVCAPTTPETPKRKVEEETPEEIVSPKKVCPDVTVVVTEEPVKECISEPVPAVANSTSTDVETASTLSDENAIATPVTCASPSTPAKANPTAADCEKSNSPKPPSYGGHKLKKAWLQRHSGEDIFDDRSRSSTNGSLSINENDGNVPTGGACSADRVANNSPLSASTVTKDSSESSAVTSLNNALNNIGSMAVNSISKNKTPKGGAKKPARDSRSSPVILNGHVSNSSKIGAAANNNSDESSSSDAETKSSPKRVPPKMKRKKLVPGSRKTQNETADETSKRKKLNSTSSTDSDKESASEKESDNSTTGKKTTSGGREDKKDSNRKRGRKPKVSGSYSPAGNGGGGGKDSNSSEGPKEKRFRDGSQEQRDLFPKPPISQLKKTGESFLQDGPCFEVAPKLAKCRECRWTANQRSRNAANIFCRFYAFRRLRYTKNGQLAIAGFSDPHKDPKQEDLNLWLPNTKNPPTDLDLEIARFTLVQVGDQFCDLLTQEAEALNIHISEDKKVAWKRVVQGIREMCDVCETTLFNFHWACSKCGFVVCIDCYKSRKNGTVKVWGDGGRDRDDMSWLLCTNRQPHEQEKLMITQVIAGDSLMTLAKLSHESRAMWDIPMLCGCPLSTSTNASSSNGICKEILRNLKQEKQKKAEQINGQIKAESNEEEGSSKKNENDALTWLADVALSNQTKSSANDDCDSSSDSDDNGNFSTLRELLIRPASKANGNSSQPGSPSGGAQSATTGASSTNADAAAAMNKPKHKRSKLDTFDEVLTNVGDANEEYLMSDGFVNGSTVELKYFVRRHIMENRLNQHRNCMASVRIMTLNESKLLYPDVPHTWLCDGRLLRLTDPTHQGNYTIFQDQWRRGQPVIVSDVSKQLDPDLWRPDSFIKDFGDVKNDLINCMTNNIVPNQPMRKFWEGFEYMSRRLKDEKGQTMLLKLKDWPPGEDFAEMLPSRYNDLMSVLPMGEYTQRFGKLNLASRLPECFVRPDLGPKMYNAYGSAMYPSKGTTNLHLDISDAVNVMVYVGIPQDGDNEEHIKEAYRAIDEAGCDILTRRRVREKGELPGALWHIYAARDADKIRDLLNKVAIERGARLEPNHDPIHDQSWYLDGPLRERLRNEYKVEGYAIVQCMGDAVFVPAGAPHQVRNLHNCIKVAEDFVSPENVSYCFHLTQEFRDLSDTHSNHEDKLQIKNIMYHAVKDSLSVLGAALLKNSNNSANVGSNAGNSNSASNTGNADDSCSSSTSKDKENGSVEDVKPNLSVKPEVKTEPETDAD